MFVDNEGARLAILKGRSSDAVLNAVAHEAALLEDANGILAWYARVPSPSNPADPPSRAVDVPWLKSGKRVSLEPCMWQLPVWRKGGGGDRALPT